jgi:predicted RNase H-like nuclease (RuvC/YqgF family)
LKFKNKQNRAANETAEIQEKKEIEYQQQIIDNVEDITQIEERANFFKQKNFELENRVEQLLIINTELKTQLEEQAETIKVFEGGNLYRYQIQILEENVANLKGKLDAVLEENNRLKQQ